ncbi:MAG: YebC/PmpR family DNA-binding transcriptional regulator [Patescibacteria group bacterium]
MSGHSKWSQIKRQKGVTDKKRGNLFTKLANGIIVAARQGGGDPAMNFKLRLAIEKAKESNVPNDNIERAIKRGTGEEGGATVDEVTYEGFGPGGTAILIEAATDNRNRSASAIRSTLSKFGGNLGSANSVTRLFTPRGVIRVHRESVPDWELFELCAIDAGAEDIEEAAEGFTVYTTPANLHPVTEVLAAKGFAAASSGMEQVPQNRVAVPDEHSRAKLEKLIEELDSNDDVTALYTNADA